MALIDMLIPGFWINYATAISAWFAGKDMESIYYINLVFPRRARCTFMTAQSSQSHDALCQLQLNGLNQYIFVVIWLWTVAQLAVTIFNFFYCIVLCNKRNMRIEILRRYGDATVTHHHVLRATNNGLLGDFFILKQIARNINQATFTDIVIQLALTKNT